MLGGIAQGVGRNSAARVDKSKMRKGRKGALNTIKRIGRLSNEYLISESIFGFKWTVVVV